MGRTCQVLRNCEELADILLEAKETEDEARKSEIVQFLRSRVCNKREKKVCCATPRTGNSAVNLQVASHPQISPQGA